MTTIQRIASLAFLTMAVTLLPVACKDAQDDHAGHDHGSEAEDDHDDDAGHDDQAEHDGDEGQHVELTPEQRRRIGLTLATAGPGSIARELTFPGEVALNPDRVAHVVPRAAGIVRAVTKTMGDTVAADEILAWIESAELAQAKLDLFAAEAEVGRSMVDLPRAKEIFANVNRLVALLSKDPGDDEPATLDGLEMGEYRGLLLTAHADLVASREALERERALRDKAISSAQDFVAAQADFRRARAAFRANLDTARFEVLAAFREATRARQLAEFAAVAAGQKLRLRGVDDASLERLKGLAPQASDLAPCDCREPCEHNTFPSLRDKLGADERLGWYALRAPFAGVVIEKHLTLGEKVGEDESAFAVADTSTVWANLSVFQNDLASVEPGQTVAVDVTGSKASHVGTIAYVAPIVDPDTRTTRARVVLANEGNALRPGLFVTVRVALATIEAGVVVPRAAVQVLDQKQVVFVAEGDGFEAVPVELGRGDRTVVEITAGLAAGQRYVEQGAFELKAKVATSGLGAHAGHGH